MEPMQILYVLVIGLLAGWLAGMIMQKQQSSLPRNLLVGIIGAFVGSFLFKVLGISAYTLVGSLVMATVGAVLFLFLVNRFLGGKLPF